jgi:hypothetical protein
MSFFRRVAPIALTLAAMSGRAMAADPEALVAPAVQPGDTWVFDETTQRGTQGFVERRIDLTVERVGSDTMVVGVKADGSPSNYQDHIAGLDWSLRRLVDDKEVTTGRPLAFPMSLGATWSTDYDELRPHGSQTAAHFHDTYKVVGWEDVVVPAGKFHVMKVEMNGVADAHLAPSASAASGVVAGATGATALSHVEHSPARMVHAVTYAEFYYSPDVKYFVKSVQEQYNSDNVMTNRDTQALVSYTPRS